MATVILSIAAIAARCHASIVMRDRATDSKYHYSDDSDASDILCTCGGDYYRDDMVQDALELASECDDHDRFCDLVNEKEAPVYNHDRLMWLAGDNSRPGYCDDAATEHGLGADVGILDRIAYGWATEWQEVAQEVWAALETLADAADSDGEEE